MTRSITKRATSKGEPRVEITHVCFIRKPGDTVRCTEPPGHDGDHFDYLSGVTDSKGRRPGVRWPRRPGETQFD